MNNKYFLSTQTSNELLKILALGSKRNFEKKFKKNTKLKILKLKKIPNLKILFFFLNTIINAFFFKKKLLGLKYKNIHLSIYVLAQTFQDYRSYTSKFIFYKNLFKNIYLAARILNFANSSLKNIVAAYIDHGTYLNGILFQCLAQRKIIIYSNSMPRGLFKIDFIKIKKKTFFSDFLKFSHSYNISKSQIKKSKIILKKIIYKSQILPWIKKIKYTKDYHYDYSKVSHVVYAHSFTDAQFHFGNDGFLNTKEWLYFTISKLLENNNKNKILLKAHPNYYNKCMGEQALWDKKIFELFKKELPDDDNLIIIDKPIKNLELLKKLENNTILISHHSTAVLEGIYFGFKCISSDKTWWDCSKLKLTNSWSNKDNYNALLKKKWVNLNYANKKDFYSVVIDYLFNPYHYGGNKHFFNIIINKLKIKDIKLRYGDEKQKKIVMNRLATIKMNRAVSKKEEIESGKIKKMNLDMRMKIIKEISENIENIFL